MPKVTKLPSGKLIFQTFDYQTNELSCETHVYPAPQGNAIGIRLTFANGVKVSEMYFGNTVKSRQDYEEQRHAYPDMPPADRSVRDDNVEEAEKLERKRQQLAAAATRLGFDPTKLTEAELFCAMIMEKGRRANAIEWVQTPKHTLGEMDEEASRRLIAKLVRAGAAAIHACEIQSFDGDRQNTGHLVVELPTQAAVRLKLLKQLEHLARKGGYRGEADAGQQLAYVKLD